jgi:hypothetical protein
LPLPPRGCEGLWEMRVVSDRVRLELLRVVRKVVRRLAETQRGKHAYRHWHSYSGSEWGRRGKTVPRGMYETYDLRLVTILRMGWEQGRIYCSASVFFFIDELTNSNPVSTTSFVISFAVHASIARANTSDLGLPPCSRSSWNETDCHVQIITQSEPIKFRVKTPSSSSKCLP